MSAYPEIRQKLSGELSTSPGIPPERLPPTFKRYYREVSGRNCEQYGVTGSRCHTRLSSRFSALETSESCAGETLPTFLTRRDFEMVRSCSHFT